MKGLLSVLLVLSLLATPMAERPEVPGDRLLTADGVARAILAGQPGGGDYTRRYGEEAETYLKGLYGLEDWTWTDAAVYAVGGADAREIAVVKPAGMTQNAPAIVAGLEEYRRERAADFGGYLPDQATLVENGVVTYGWGWVALLLCEDMDAATAAFESAAGTAEVYGEDLTPADTRWFQPFDPPNKFDMSLYDTSAILAAYASGDESGLSDRDAAILARCREVLGGCVTGDMTAFEKERRVYAWLVEYGQDHKDLSVYDPRTPRGQADNTDPYGVLVRGQGICLGYATTFQLLMKLAGVECITVVGARKENREDHAWNLVRLEGEWYCADPTLDSTAWAAWGRYGHFNVTSAYLREQDFQWDYYRVPEATAQRFYWNGVGEVPQ